MRVKGRRQAREAALLVLFEVELGKTLPEDSMAHLEAFGTLPADLQVFARSLIEGVVRHGKELDETIRPRLHEYDFSRIAAVDRNLLRLAAFELLHCPDIPPKATLDEAIELAKKYSTAESGKFVNGVLAALLADSPKADWTPNLHEPIEAPKRAEPDLTHNSEEAPLAKEAAKVGKWKIRAEEPPP